MNFYESISRLLFAGLLTLSLFSCSKDKQEKATTDKHVPAQTKSTKGENKPNFIIFFLDDAGYGDLACFGNEQIATPNLDQMAREGMKLTEFYSASSVCSPSRAGLLTGRYPIRMGIQPVFFPESWTGMDPEELTIAELVQQQGYRTGMVGKWHLGHRPRFLPTNQGFEDYYGAPYSNDMKGFVYLEGDSVDSLKVDQRYNVKTYTQKALAFLDENQDEPFFLYLTQNMPHIPLAVSEQFKGTSKGGPYGDVMEELDWSLGQVMGKVKELGLDSNTVVFFTSDNGPWLAFGPDSAGTAGPLREGKQTCFEGGFRVPALARWPGHIPAGVVYEDMMSTLDLLPTIAEWAGAQVPKDRSIDGHSMAKALTQHSSSPRKTMAYWHSGEFRAFRRGKWKLKLPYEGHKAKWWKSAVPAHDTLLFDLKADPGEQHNLFTQYPDTAKRVLKAMQAHRKALGELPPLKVVR